MNCDNFMRLVNLIRHRISPSSDAFRSDTIAAEKRVAMVLYYLKDQGSFRMTSNTFGVSLASLSVSLRLVCFAINDIIGPEMIKFPDTTESVKKAVTLFESKFGFPQVIGCVDGTHIPIKQPNENPHDYFCYKMKYSLNCQAICDEKGSFIDVELRWPGSVHDARVYSNCNVNKKLLSGEIPTVYQELIPGFTPVPAILIGDPAYPLLPNLMKEYSSCTEEKHVVFNNKLRLVRNQIECAFGRLKARWRILNRPVDVDLNFAISMIYSCFVLHNFCEQYNEEIHSDLIKTAIQNELRCQSCQHHKQLYHLYSHNSARGKLVRDVITEYLYDIQG